MAERATTPHAGVLTEEALERWGRDVGEALQSGRLSTPLVLGLRGPLGAGKSVLARAVARGVGVTSPMPSPTYNLLFTYDTSEAPGGVRTRGAVVGAGWGESRAVVVHHLDLYRLENPDDVWELGWEELGVGHEVVLIEWPERAEALLPPDRWDVRLGFPGAADEDDPEGVEGLRTVRVERVGSSPAPPALPAREVADTDEVGEASEVGEAGAGGRQ